MKRIIIVGGGISGLTAARTIQKKNKTNICWDLYEAGSTFSGKFKTIKRDGFIIEKGPDSFLARKPAGMNLIYELGLEDELVANATGRSYIYCDQKLHPIPDGAVMGIPTDEKALFASDLFSESGKKRAALEKKLPYLKSTTDSSLGVFFEKRFGKEVVKKLIEPLFSGIYADDLYKMSLRATFPQFEKIMEQSGSLMEGLKKPHQVDLATTGTKNTIGAFRTLKNGLESFPRALVQSLPSKHLHNNKKVISLNKNQNKGYTLFFADGSKEEADAVIVAATHDTLIQLLDKDTIAPFAFEPLTTLATISLAYPDAERVHLPEGTGYLVARTKNYHTTACTWVHKKWTHMVPKGKVLLRAFIGKAGIDAVSSKSDQELIEAVLSDYKEMMGLREAPLFAEVSRIKAAMPTYHVGHLGRLKSLEQNVQMNYPRLTFCGMSYAGVGIPDCLALAQAKTIALLNEVERCD